MKIQIASDLPRGRECRKFVAGLLAGDDQET